MIFRIVFTVVLLFLGHGVANEPALATEASQKLIKFAPSDAVFINPERGFWQFAADDFADVTNEDLREIRSRGVSIVYAVARLDAYRNMDLPPEFLTKLDAAFEKTRQAGVKSILRFVYNYPDSSSDYESAKDAPLPVVLRHIAQLGPLINRHKDVLAIVQAGLIGAWGEQHTSSSGLDTDAVKLKIRDALLAAIDPDISIQWRYPPDIISWQKEGRPDVLSRTAFHNDCFLSSPTDVGSYDETEKIRTVQRAAMMALSENSFFSGETCDADKSQIRKACSDILQEGAQFHLSALGLDYYLAFHKNWKKQGCYQTIQNKMGYRFEFVSATLSQDASGTAELVIAVKNDGWARLGKDRKLTATLFDGSNKLVSSASLGGLSKINPGQVRDFPFHLKTTAINTSGPYNICFIALDPAESLQGDVRYAIRFANSEAGKSGIKFDGKTGQHCFALEKLY